VAASCFLMIIAQSSATARAYALLPFDREILDEDTDLVALSAANVAAALSGTFVVNGVSERRQIKPSSRPKDYVRAGSFLTKRGSRLRE